MNAKYPPHIYFAGKISKNDFRTAVLGNRAGSHGYYDYEHNRPLDEFFIKTRLLKPQDFEFVYTGPFFISCDHSCGHLGDHACLGELDESIQIKEEGGVFDTNQIGCLSEDFPLLTRKKIIERNNFGLKKADFVIAYVEDQTCFGTLVELGMAVALHIPILLLFKHSKDADFWYIANQAKEVHENISESNIGFCIQAFFNTHFYAENRPALSTER